MEMKMSTTNMSNRDRTSEGDRDDVTFAGVTSNDANLRNSDDAREHLDGDEEAAEAAHRLNEEYWCEDCGEAFDEPEYVECDLCDSDLPCCPICLAQPKLGCARCFELEQEIIDRPRGPR
jgi:hypothetical protein